MVSGRPRQWIDGVAARPDSELEAITAKHVLCIVVDRASIGSDGRRGKIQCIPRMGAI
jgi:hypothetical protein